MSAGYHIPAAPYSSSLQETAAASIFPVLSQLLCLSLTPEVEREEDAHSCRLGKPRWLSLPDFRKEKMCALAPSSWLSKSSDT